MEELKTKISEFDMKKVSLREKINNKNQEIKTFTAELELKREREKEFNVKLSQFRKKRDDKLNEIAILERKRAEDTGQFERLDDLISALEVTKNRAAFDLEELKNEIGESEWEGKKCNYKEVEIDLDSFKNSPKEIRKKIYSIESSWG